ncbi:hypothetical protein BDY19DRAFT_304867 [Irpex rosettiformis]|uniref:Uncharacterized protein n=1 Tax=Irpex rosettiformis TaxID=378272 RepID=A0ACB8TYY6_9APHY|nr:hypothetical protein BDY19DRAFT_304867 [Irpex rosettiformis]
MSCDQALHDCSKSHSSKTYSYSSASNGCHYQLSGTWTTSYFSKDGHRVEPYPSVCAYGNTTNPHSCDHKQDDKSTLASQYLYADRKSRGPSRSNKLSQDKKSNFSQPYPSFSRQLLNLPGCVQERSISRKGSDVKIALVVNEQDLYCPLCAMQFPGTVDGASHHLRKHHPKHLASLRCFFFTSAECNARRHDSAFADVNSLVVHMIQHLGVSIPCPRCSATFSDDLGLWKHTDVCSGFDDTDNKNISLPGGSSIHAWNVNASTSTTSSSYCAYRPHRPSHTPPNTSPTLLCPLSCEEPEIDNDTPSIREHLREHHHQELRRKTCFWPGECHSRANNTVMTSSGIVVHMLGHFRPRVVCEYCLKELKYEKNLKRHKCPMATGFKVRR